MAKQMNGYMGGFSGKLGPAVGYMWNGRWVMRSLPTQVRNPRTEAQMAQRDLFKREVQLAASMRMAIVPGLTALAREAHMTSYNLFVSLNQDCFALADGQFAVRWEGLRLSEGPVAPVLPGNPVLSADNVLTVSFDKNISAPRANNYDRVSLYLYCAALGSGFLAAPVYRRDKKVSVMLPDDYVGHSVHLYCFVQDEYGAGSTTVYGGCIVPGQAAQASPVADLGPGQAEGAAAADADVTAMPSTDSALPQAQAADGVGVAWIT